MKEKQLNGSANSRPANGKTKKEMYGTIEIRDCEQERIYHNVGKLEDIKKLAESAKNKLKSKGYKIKSLRRGQYWEATHKELMDIFITIENLEWLGIESETNDLVDWIDEYFEEI